MGISLVAMGLNRDSVQTQGNHLIEMAFLRLGEVLKEIAVQSERSPSDKEGTESIHRHGKSTPPPMGHTNVGEQSPQWCQKLQKDKGRFGGPP